MIAPSLLSWGNETFDDAARGVNARLLTLPIGTDNAPPPPVRVFNAKDHPWVAQLSFDMLAECAELQEGPALILTFSDVLEVNGSPQAFGGLQDVVNMICYYVSGPLTIDTDASQEETAAELNAAPAIAFTDAFRTLRAVRRVLIKKFVALVRDDEPLVIDGMRFEAPQKLTQHRMQLPGREVLQLTIPMPYTDYYALSAEDL